jgi:hypothetical protein
VALSQGSFDEQVELPPGVTLRGACVAGTLLTSSQATNDYAVINISGAGAVVGNLRLSGPRPGLLLVWGSARVEDVVVDQASLFGLGAHAAGTLTGRSVIVRRTQASPVDGQPGRGVYLEGTGVIDLEQAVVEENLEVGIHAIQGRPTLRLRDVVVRGTRLFGEVGDGVDLSTGVTLEAAGLVLEGNAALGMLAIGRNIKARIEDAVIRGNGSDGAQISQGASVEMQRVRLENNSSTGVVVTGDGTSATIENARVSGNGERAASILDGAGATLKLALLERNQATALLVGNQLGTQQASLTLEDVTILDHPGSGLLVQFGGGAELSRVIIERAQTAGIAILEAGSTAVLSDVVIRDTVNRATDGDPGRGLEVRLQAHAEGSRLLLERNRDHGIFVESAGTSAAFSDLVIRDTETRQQDDQYGRGLEAEGGAEVTVERALFERNREVAVMAGGAGTHLSLTDVEVRDTRGAGGGIATGGDGLLLSSGARGVLTRALFVRNREVAIAVFEPGTELQATDLVIADTLVRECAQDRCAGFAAGIGLGAYLGSHMDMRRFSVLRSAMCGVQLGGAEEEYLAGAVDLHDGEVADNPIGANVQDPGFDLDRLSDNVIYRNNLRNADMSQLPVPTVGRLPE